MLIKRFYLWKINIFLQKAVWRWS